MEKIKSEKFAAKSVREIGMFVVSLSNGPRIFNVPITVGFWFDLRLGREKMKEKLEVGQGKNF